eukprot:6490367-Amphidinium_carterae.4
MPNRRADAPSIIHATSCTFASAAIRGLRSAYNAALAWLGGPDKVLGLSSREGSLNALVGLSGNVAKGSWSGLMCSKASASRCKLALRNAALTHVTVWAGVMELSIATAVCSSSRC